MDNLQIAFEDREEFEEIALEGAEENDNSN